NNPTVREAALEAGVAVRALVDEAIAAARADPSDADTIVKRLLAAQQTAQDELSDVVIRSILIGMITGFVPTNTMAAGNTLEMLLRRPDFMAQARDAARSGDDARLKRCLFEAFRFKPLNPGPFRVVAEDYVVGEGTRRAKRIPKGTQLMVCTQSAMFDPRRIERPNRFDPERRPSNYLLFGHGLHWCVGAPLAEAQITQTLKPLLLKRNLRRAPGPAGRLQKSGPFPAHLVVEWDPD
ncbi:MAG: cytochrome P450, partial [Pseudomonadota bacterium]|nr:cytochrome P450 [Pseudomonadota bacterium]